MRSNLVIQREHSEQLRREQSELYESIISILPIEGYGFEKQNYNAANVHVHG